MKKEHLDNIGWTHRLNSYESQVSDSLFERLDINKKRKRRPIGLLLFLGLSLLLGSGVIYFYWNLIRSDLYIEDSHLQPSSTTKHLQAVIDDKAMYNQSHNNTSYLLMDLFPDAIMTNNYLAFPKMQNKILNIIDATYEKNILNINSEVVSNSSRDVDFGKKKQQNLPHKKFPSKIFNNKNSSETSTLTSSSVKKEVPSTTRLDDSHPDISKNSQLFNETPIQSTDYTPTTLEFIGGNAIDFIATPFSLINSEQSNSLRAPDCPSVFEIKNVKHEIELAGGLFRPRRELKNNTKGELGNAYSSIRDKKETVLKGYSFAILYRMRHRNGLSIASGVDYQLHEEKFVYSTDLKKVTTIEEKFDNQGRLLSRDTVMGTSYSKKTIYNRYQRVAIPLMIGVAKRFNRFFLRAEIGANVGMLVSRSGSIYDTDLSVYDLKKDENSYFKKSIIAEGIVRLSVGVDLNDNTQMILTPEFHLGMTPYNNKVAPLDQYYRKLGLKLGVIMFLGND